MYVLHSIFAISTEYWQDLIPSVKCQNCKTSFSQTAQSIAEGGGGQQFIMMQGGGGGVQVETIFFWQFGLIMIVWWEVWLSGENFNNLRRILSVSWVFWSSNEKDDSDDALPTGDGECSSCSWGATANGNQPTNQLTDQTTEQPTSQTTN